MLLSLLDDFPSSRTFAVDEDGVLWLRFTPGRWGRGCLSADGARHVFLRPAWAGAWTPLTLFEYLRRFSPSTERSVA